jgi:hypothetical protein
MLAALAAFVISILLAWDTCSGMLALLAVLAIYFIGLGHLLSHASLAYCICYIYLIGSW